MSGIENDKKRRNGNNRKRTRGRNFTHVPILKKLSEEEAKAMVQAGKTVFVKYSTHVDIDDQYLLDTGRTKVVVNKPPRDKGFKFPNV